MFGLRHQGALQVLESADQTGQAVLVPPLRHVTGGRRGEIIPNRTASGWQPTAFATRDRCLKALVDVMRYDPVEAVRNAAADGLRYTHGGELLREIDLGQPMMDAFVVKKRKRPRWSSRRSRSL